MTALERHTPQAEQDLLLISSLNHEAHAARLQARLLGAWTRCLEGATEPDEGARPLIWASWLRSRESGIASDEFHYAFIGAPVLENRLRDNRLLIETASQIMQDLLTYNPHGHINLTDAEGVTLHYSGLDITPVGSVLLENVQGTNCTGLALREKRLVYVLAEENYKLALRRRRMHCAAAPICDPQGRLLGALTLTAEVGNFHFHTLGTVQAAAEAVSRQLALKALLDEQRTVLEVLNEGLITLDDKGLIRAINRYARRLLQVDGHYVGRPFSTLVGGDAESLGWLVRRDVRHDLDISLPLPDGGTLPCLVSVCPTGQGGCVLSLRENRRIRELARRVMGTRARYTFDSIQGDCAAIQACLRLARAASRSDSTTLILGESGVGKELFAQAIHNASSRAQGPFVAVNCGAIPRDLVQSELFGHVEGAFTGAARGGSAGKFELADGGTLFLDEIGDMPFDAQASLLRVLQEGEVTRVGGKKAQPVNVRVIAATHKNLGQAVADRAFREDVYYRLNVLTLVVPPLRERLDDIPAMALFLLGKQARSLDKPIAGISAQALAALCRYSWPGNVRELENVIERAANLASGSRIELADLPPELQGEPGGPAPSAKGPSSLEAQQRELIIATLRQTAGNMRQTAQALGISRGGLYVKLKRFGLEASHFRP